MRSQALLLSTVLGLSYASPFPSVSSPESLFKRWDTTVCPLIPPGTVAIIPDDVSFTCPVENGAGGGPPLQTATWNLCKDAASVPCSDGKVSFDLDANNWLFTISIPGTTYESVTILMSTTSPPTDLGHTCTQQAGGWLCSVPYKNFAPNAQSYGDVLKAMCPNGADVGLIFYMDIQAVVDGHTYYSQKMCLDPFTWTPTSCQNVWTTDDFWQLSYRCSQCPAVQYACHSGTAYGVTVPWNGGDTSSVKVFNQPIVGQYGSHPVPNTCKKWGFYSVLPPSGSGAGDVDATYSGQLWVGVGQNDLPNKGSEAGTYTIKVQNKQVFVTYNLFAGPTYLEEVHVDVRCEPTSKSQSVFPTCAPGKYAYSQTLKASDAVQQFTNPTGIPIPCSGQPVYVIVHAAVGASTTLRPDQVAGYSCPPAQD